MSIVSTLQGSHNAWQGLRNPVGGFCIFTLLTQGGCCAATLGCLVKALWATRGQVTQKGMAPVNRY